MNNKIEPDALAERLDERLSEMCELSSVVTVVKQAKQDVEGKEAVVSQARKTFIEKSSVLAKALQESGLKDIDALKLEWSEFQNLLASTEYTALLEKKARDFFNSGPGVPAAPCRIVNKSAQQSIHQRNAVKGHLDTHTEKLQSA